MRIRRNFGEEGVGSRQPGNFGDANVWAEQDRADVGKLYRGQKSKDSGEQRDQESNGVQKSQGAIEDKIFALALAPTDFVF